MKAFRIVILFAARALAQAALPTCARSCVAQSAVTASTSSSSGSPTSSPVTTGPTTPKHKDGLSPGAIAGIAIGAIFLLVLFAFCLCKSNRPWGRFGGMRHRPPSSSERYYVCGYGPSTPRGGWSTHELPVGYAEMGNEPSRLRSSRPTEELPTDEPMHSISRKELAILAKRYNPNESRIAAENLILTVQSKGLKTTANDHELEGSSTAELQSPAQAPQQTFSQPFQPLAIEASVGSYGSNPESRVAHDAVSLGTSSETPLSEGASSSRMDELREKREKISVEKERLLKLQELDELEAAVQREMLEEEQRARGDVSPK